MGISNVRWWCHLYERLDRPTGEPRKYYWVCGQVVQQGVLKCGCGKALWITHMWLCVITHSVCFFWLSAHRVVGNLVLKVISGKSQKMGRQWFQLHILRFGNLMSAISCWFLECRSCWLLCSTQKAHFKANGAGNFHAHFHKSIVPVDSVLLLCQYQCTLL